jgi:hypothetical protein
MLRICLPLRLRGKNILLTFRFVESGNGLLLFFRVGDFDLALQGTLSRPSVRRGATRESEHSKQAVLIPRSGRIFRYDQCVLFGLTRHCGCRALMAFAMDARQPLSAR